MAKKYYQINQFIKSDQLRVVDEAGIQLGVMSKEAAIAKAQADSLDVILVAPGAKPPVAKITDFAKFKYELKQKDKSGKKKTKSVDIKEIRFTPFIAEGDYAVRIKKAKEFLDDGNKVKLNVKFVGRQITRKQFGENLIHKAINELSDMATVEREPSFQGKILSAQLQPKKK
jgi:translation initiation factor IF-3